MRMLVDGLNTIPEPEGAKGVETFVWGKRANLDKARHYVLDPAFSRIFAVSGFATETGVAGKYREFVVRWPSTRWRQRRQFTDQIGLITVAFYYPATSRALLWHRRRSGGQGRSSPSARRERRQSDRRGACPPGGR